MNQYAARMARARERMDYLGVDVLLLSVGADLPYLTGYEAMPPSPSSTRPVCIVDQIFSPASLLPYAIAQASCTAVGKYESPIPWGS